MMTVSSDDERIISEQPKWKCKICGKAFENWYILNYHKLLEHSESKRPPIGVG